MANKVRHINPLFAHSSPGVQALAREAVKNQRAQQRAEWKAKNKPAK